MERDRRVARERLRQAKIVLVEVSHVGDLIENMDANGTPHADEWQMAIDTYEQFEIGTDWMPHSISIGNHDYDDFNDKPLTEEECFVENFGPALIARVGAQAPGVRLRFVQKIDKDSTPLREGMVDMETGVIGEGMGPEVRVQALFRDRFIGAVRPEHALCRGRITAARYAGGRHVLVSRRGRDTGPMDDALLPLALHRDIIAVVGGFAAALALARTSDIVATVPERHTSTMREGMFSFALPMPVPEIAVSLMWHPRLQADPAHQWLRECMRAVCAPADAA